MVVFLPFLLQFRSLSQCFSGGEWERRSRIYPVIVILMGVAVSYQSISVVSKNHDKIHRGNKPEGLSLKISRQACEWEGEVGPSP